MNSNRNTIEVRNFGNYDKDMNLTVPTGLVFATTYEGKEEYDPDPTNDKASIDIFHKWKYDLLPDELNRKTYPIEMVKVCSFKDKDLEENSDKIIYTRLFYQPKDGACETTMNYLFENCLDSYHTFFKRLLDFSNGFFKVSNMENDKPIFNMHDCIDFDGCSYISIITDIESGEIIGYLVKDENADEEDSPNFYFKDNNIGKKYLLDYFKNIVVSINDGGTMYNMRDLINISDEDMMDYLNEFTFESLTFINRIKHITIPKSEYTENTGNVGNIGAK